MLGDHDANKMMVGNDYCNGLGNRRNWEARAHLWEQETVQCGWKWLHRAAPFTEAQLEAKREGKTKVRPRTKLSCCLQGYDIEVGVQRVNLENGWQQRKGITEHVRLLKETAQKSIEVDIDPWMAKMRHCLLSEGESYAKKEISRDEKWGNPHLSGNEEFQMVGREARHLGKLEHHRAKKAQG